MPESREPRLGAKDHVISARGASPSVKTVTGAAPESIFPVIWKLGRRYLLIRVVLVACYVIGHLFTQTILPRQTTVYLAIITNHFQGAVGRTTGTSTIAAAPATTVTNGPSSRKAAATSMSKNLLGTYWFWVALVILLVAGGFAFQCVVALLDGTIANAIRRDVFSSLLRQSPKFYHEHDSDRLTMVVTQYCSQIAGMLRRLLVDPVLQAIGIIVIGTTIYKALAALASGPPSAAAQLWAPYGLSLIHI